MLSRAAQQPARNKPCAGLDSCFRYSRLFRGAHPPLRNYLSPRPRRLFCWCFGWVRLRLVMVVADFAGDFPFAVFVLPQADVFAFAGWIVGFWVHEAVRAQLYCAVAFHVICLERSGNQVAAHISATDV